MPEHGPSLPGHGNGESHQEQQGAQGDSATDEPILQAEDGSRATG